MSCKPLERASQRPTGLSTERLFYGGLSASAVTISIRPVVVFEGVCSTRPELADLVDFRVLVSVSDADRIYQLQGREGHISDWEYQWHRAEDWYVTTIATPDTFDVVVSW